MLKVGDILWTFGKHTYSVGEISELSIFRIGENLHYFVSTNGIIGANQKTFVPATKDFNTLVKVRYLSTVIYYTTSEKEAVKFIESHYNETDNQRNLQQDASK